MSMYNLKSATKPFNVLVSCCQTDVAILARQRIVVALHRGRSYAQQHLSSVVHTCQHDGSRACMIARSGVLLLERCLVFLVDDDQSETAEGQKHSRTCTKYHVVWLV